MKNQPRVVLVAIQEEIKITHDNIIDCVIKRFEGCSLPDTEAAVQRCS